MAHAAPDHAHVSTAELQVVVRKTFIDITDETQMPLPLIRAQSMPAYDLDQPTAEDVDQPTPDEYVEILPCRWATTDKYEEPERLGSLVALGGHVWRIEARKLEGTDTRLVTSCELGGETFKMMIFPSRAWGGQAGANFKRSEGKGVVHVKCEGRASHATAGGPDTGSLVLNIMAGRDADDAKSRGHLQTLFKPRFESALLVLEQECDFRPMVDETSKTLVVCLELFSAPGPYHAEGFSQFRHAGS